MQFSVQAQATFCSIFSVSCPIRKATALKLLRFGRLIWAPELSAAKMRSLCSLLLLLCLNHACLAQESVSAQPAITVRSTLVMVPVFVNTKKGQPVFGLQADDFRLTDNGVQQTLTLERDTDSQPLAL